MFPFQNFNILEDETRSIDQKTFLEKNLNEG